MKKNIFIIISIFLILFFSLSFFIWQGIYLPKDRLKTEGQLFFVKQGMGDEEIAISLRDQGLIKHQLFFNFYTLLTGIDDRLQVGPYLLNPAMSIAEIANIMARGDVYTKTITIPEGFTIKQIEKRFSKTFDRTIDLSQFRLSDFQDEFDFLKDVFGERGLEGFLFPDTYQFKYLITEKEIARIMLRNFQRRLPLVENRIIFEIITMASILEKEVRGLEEKRMVSDIFWRRIDVNMPLQADATIVYFLEKQGLIPEQGWTFQEMRREVGLAIAIDSPYNTYLRRGLPAGPISNPGFNSIFAAINPITNDYWFYLSTPGGKTIFSRTYQEHQKAIEKYF